MLSGSRGGGHPWSPVVKPGSTKHETGSAAAAQAAAAAAVASVQGKELAKASKQQQQQQDCSDHAAEGDKSATCLLSFSLSLSVLPRSRVFGGDALCEVLPSLTCKC